jgi:opacity protein-like surface antigen
MRLASVVFLLSTFAAVASAQVGELAVSVGQSLYRNEELGSDGFSGYKVKDGFRISPRFTINTKRVLGWEFGYAYTNSKLALVDDSAEARMDTHQFFGNLLLYATPEGSVIRPFVAGGGHVTTFVWPGASALYGQGTNKFGYNYGGGVKVKLSPLYAIRFDIRDYVQGKPFGLLNQSGLLRQLEISAGFGIHF